MIGHFECLIGLQDLIGKNKFKCKRSLAGGGSGIEQSDISVCGLIGHRFLQNMMTSLSWVHSHSGSEILIRVVRTLKRISSVGHGNLTEHTAGT